MEVISKKHNISELSLEALCVILWFQGSLMSTVWIFFNKVFRVPYDFSQSFLMPLLIVALIMASLPVIKKRINTLQLFIYFAFIIIFVLSFLAHPNNPAFEEMGLGYCFLILPYVFLGSFYDISKLKKILYLLSILVVLKDTLFMFVFRSDTTTELIEGGEYMSAAYNLLPSVLFLIWNAFSKPRLYNILLSFYSVFLLLAYGNRGSVLCVVFFVISYVVYQNFKKIKKWQLISVLIGVGLVIRYLDEILIFFQLLLGSLGFSTRIFDLMGEDGFGEDDSTQGRLYYYNKALSALGSDNFMGLGMAGDRIPLNGGYSHNIIIESIVSYGFFFGPFFLFMLFLLLFFSIRRVKNADETVFLLILICIGFVPLFISGSYVTDHLFYLLLGYCSFILKKRNTASYVQSSFS